MEPKNISESLEEESWVDANAIRIDEEEWLSETQLDWLLKGHQARGRKNYDEMDVKSAFLYGKIDEEVYVSQPQGFQDPKSTKKSWVMSFEAVMKSRISDDSMREPLLSWPTSLKTEPDGIFISQDKYVAEILKKFDFASYQVTPKTTHLSAGQTNFRYLKGKPKLGLWNPRESSFDLNPNSDSELCWRQILTGNPQQEKPKYVAAASCCGQVLWIQNQMLDYGFNFMNTKIYIDNESTICIVKNPVYHSKTKHIAIRHHFIRDAYEKKLIQSKNTLVKHFEDMRLYIPSKEYLLVWFDPPRHESMSCLTTKGMHTIGAGASSKRPSEALPTPSPAPTSEVPLEPLPDSSPAQTSKVPIEHQPDPSPRPSPTTTIPDSIPETSGENLGGHSSSDKSLLGYEGDMTIQGVYDLCLSLCKQVSDQAKEIQDLKAQITKLKKQAKPVIKHHKAYLKSNSLKQRFPRKSFSKKHRVYKESVSKQGRKFTKGESAVQRDPLFDVMLEDTIDHMET
ncbi:putative ribonuclease H-like domain-containing protein [Tanacetum coccineum]